ncbi:MAG: hypothetical protein AB9M60_24030 [Leptothrix sp. (in: b-proteobacteria)]
MQRKLLVTLVAGALELYAASMAHAQVASCQNNAATAVRSGPLSPVDGFPEYVTDSNGVSIQRCLDARFCFASPVIATDPFSVQIGSGIEAFYWGATAVVTDTNNAAKLTVVMAAETAFLQSDPNTGAPIDGGQFPFLRLRINLIAPAAGNYTLVHPYGTDTFTVDAVSGGRDIFRTIDRGFAPNSTFTGPVGPFLKWDGTAPATPAGFLGDGNPNTGVNHTVTGSPCGTNFVRLTGRDFSGTPLILDPATGSTALTTNLFSVQGQLYDGKVQTPVSATRLTYSRAAGALGQIDAFATSTPTATVTVQDGPTTTPARARITAPVTMSRSTSAQGVGLDSASVAVTGANTDALPPVLSVTAADTSTAPGTDPTTLIRPLVDLVTITQAEYDTTTQTLRVAAVSGDQRVPPTLTLHGYGVAPGTAITTVAPPAVVTVDSSAGGRATAQVRVIPAAAPLAPTTLAAVSNSPTQVTLTWADNATNEASYDVQRNGVVIATLAANSTSFVDTTVAQDTAYTYQVFAANNGGRTGSTVVSVTTPVQLNAPSNLAASAVAFNSVTLSWTDNAGNESGFVVLRNGVTIATLAANATTYTDATVAGSTTYSYQVAATHPRAANAASAAISVTTPIAPPAAPTALVATVNTPTQVTLTWTDNAVNEGSYEIQRNGVVVAVLGINASAFTDTGLTSGTTYSYQVFAVNSAGRTGSAVVNATPAAVVAAPAAPTALRTTAVAANSVALAWTDASTNEANFQVLRNGVVIATLAANAVAYTDATVAASTTYTYTVAAVNTGGTGTSAPLSVTTPAAKVIAAPTSLVANAGALNAAALGWADASTGESAYRVQRATVTIAANGTPTVGALAVPTTPTGNLAANATAYTNTGLTANTVYAYDVNAVDGTVQGTATRAYFVNGGMPAVAGLKSNVSAGGLLGVGATPAGQVPLSWTASTLAQVAGYEIQRCIGAATVCTATSTNWTNVTSVTGRATASFTVTGIPSGQLNQFRIRSSAGATIGLTGTYSAAVAGTPR